MAVDTCITNNTDLKTGMKIVIPTGEMLVLDGEVYPSRISPGFIVAETESGQILFRGDLTTKVVVSDDPADTKVGAL